MFELKVGHIYSKGLGSLRILGTILLAVGIFSYLFIIENMGEQVWVVLVTIAITFALGLALRMRLYSNRGRKKRIMSGESEQEYHTIPLGVVVAEIRLPASEEVTLLRIRDLLKSKFNSGTLDNLMIKLSRKTNPHTAVFGESGSGKTTISRQVACTASKTMGVIIVDFHGEYGQLSEQCGFCVIDVSHNIPNPFKLYGQSPSIRALQLAFMFSKLFNFGRIQRSLLTELIMKLYASRGSGGSCPSLRDFIRLIDSELESGNTKDNDFRRSLRSLKSSFVILETIINKEKSIDLEKCNSIVLDFSVLNIENLQEFVAELVLTDVYYNTKRLDKDLLIIVDEAHRLLPSDSENGVLRRIAQEGRKFGVFLWLVTQNPLDVDSRILNNVANRIFFRMSERRNVDHVTKLLAGEHAGRLDYKRLENVLRNLDTGVGIFQSAKTNNLIVFRAHDPLLVKNNE